MKAYALLTVLLLLIGAALALTRPTDPFAGLDTKPVVPVPEVEIGPAVPVPVIIWDDQQPTWECTTDLWGRPTPFQPVGYLSCLARAHHRALVVSLFSVLATLVVVMTSRSRRVKAGLRALKGRAQGILRLLYWPALGAGLFYSMVATWIEWKYARGYDYNDHLVWATLFAGIFTGLLAIAIQRLWRAARAAR